LRNTTRVMALFNPSKSVDRIAFYLILATLACFKIMTYFKYESMKPILFFFLLISLKSFSQSVSYEQKLDSLKKYHLINTYSQETISTTNYYTSSGSRIGSATARGIFIDFRVGIDGPIKNIGHKGKSLLNIIKNDPEALAELNKAYKVHLRKKRVCNVLEVVGYVVIAGGAAALFLGLDNYGDEGVTPAAVIGGVGVIGGLTEIIVFHKLTDKHMDAFSESIQRSIQIYNNNLIAKIK
jgi:hypothetical protein